jgi:hypothetical protein
LNRALDAGEADLLQLALVRARILAARRDRPKAELGCRLTHIELDRLTGATGAPGS